MVKPVVDAVDIDLKTGTTLGFYSYGLERPTLMIVGAMDGRSATAVYACYLIMKHLEKLSRIDGSVTVLPVANPLAFRLGARVSPLDSMDLDSVFPGNERGTVTERTAWEIWRRVSQADYVLHFKTGEMNSVSHTTGLHREYIHVRNLASQVALPLVVESSGQRGALATEAAHEGTAVASIVMRGDSEHIDSQAAVEVREAVLNLMRLKDMIPGERIESSPALTGRLQYVNVDTEGFYVPTVNLGESVSAGDEIGKVQDKSEVVSPYNGAVISLRKMNYVFEGDLVAGIAPPLSDDRGYRQTEQEEPPPKRRKW
jgi:predicted deacylase